MIKRDAHAELEGLDALRGLLAIIVCLAHAWQIFVRPVEPEGVSVAALIAGLGARMAVLWFFCLSGFVIALAVERNKSRYGFFNLADYTLSRFYRILPPLLAAIGITAILAQVLHGLGMADAPAFPKAMRASYTPSEGEQFQCLLSLCARGYLTGTVNGPLWSLAYEIQLYVVVGLGAAVFHLRPRAGLRVLAGVILVAFAGMAIIGKPEGYTRLQALAFISFAAGWCVALYPVSRRMRLTVAACGLSALIGVAAYLKPAVAVNGLDENILMVSGQLIFVAGAALLLPMIGTLRAPRLARTGAYSYSLYILHVPIMLAVFFVVANSTSGYSLGVSWCIAALAVPATVLFSAMIAKVVERSKTQREIVGRAFDRVRQFVTGFYAVRSNTSEATQTSNVAPTSWRGTSTSP